MEKYNRLEKQKQEEIGQLLNTIYNFNYPIYVTRQFYSRKKQRIISRSFYVNNLDEIHKLSKSFHKNIYISVATKTPEYTQLKNARNTENNTAEIGYFVIDLDSQYCVSKNSAEKIVNVFFSNKLFKNCPVPTAIIKSGGGLHFYYALKKPIYLFNTKNKKYFISQYRLAVETVRNKVNKALLKLKKETSDAYLGEYYNVLKTLHVDPALCGSPNQLIRLVGSYNYKTREEVEIIYLNTKNKYLTGNLITEYHNRYEDIEYKFQNNILPAAKYEKIRKDKLKNNVKNIQYSKSVLTLNLERLEGIKKLTLMRKENYCLRGTRQKIMAQTAWCLINYNENTNKDTPELDELEELQKIGELIGGYFATRKYAISKLRHLKKYHNKRDKLTNNTIIKRLEINNTELKELPEFWESKDKIRINKKEIKKEIKKKAYKLWLGGESQSKIAQKCEVSKTTVKRWVKEWKDKVINI